jgi:hypothetical protein
MTRHSLFHIVFVLTVAGVIAAPRGAEACSCIGPQPACSAFWDDGAVFAGRVLGIDRATTGDRPVRVRFAVLEAFKGVTTAEVEVVTGSGGGDCGYSFAVGASYFVYAYRSPSSRDFSTGICSRTRALSAAAEDLSYARSVPAASYVGATITGIVYDQDSNIATTPGAVRLAPLAGVRVLFDCQGSVFDATTGADGRFAIAGVPVGSCRSRVDPPARGGISDVVIRDPRGCAAVELIVSKKPSP